MPFITVGLLRKRAEHNEGCLADLEEIALHQQDLEGITVIGDMCRKLQILYLCNNYIPRIENLHHLKCLTYLNLAVNSIKIVEGLEHCEMLTKLDLTLNFIADLESVRSLRANPFLETLHLTGNPCTQTAGYRHYVIQSLPQLKTLDGELVKRSELIVARQDSEDTRETAHTEALKAREAERIKDEMRARGIDPFPAKFNEQGERVYGHSAEERLQMLRETQEEEEKKKQVPHDPNSISAIHAELNKKPVAITPEQEIEKYGHVLQKNEAKLPYSMEEDVVGTQDVVVVTVEPGRFISTTLINVDVQPTYVRVEVKGKVLQLHTPVEVALTGIKVVRSQTTGQLKITIPVAAHIATERAMKRRRTKELTSIDD